jgi:ATP-binding cassette subfamily F protein 3
MLSISGVTKSFAGRVLFENASVQINRGDRIGLVGPNGAGKSTLFSLILSHDTPDEGTLSLQRGSTLGFLPQESAPAGDETVLDLATGRSATHAEIDPEDPDADFNEDYEAMGREPKAKRILSGLGFRDGDYDKPARTFSGGWVMRAHLARLLVLEPDLLMLDEPTNHLDLEALGWFQDYLLTYPGAFFVISHDREFLNVLCNTIIEIRNRRLWRYTGNYDGFLGQREAQQVQQQAAYDNQQREIAALQQFIDRFRAKASKAAQAQDRIKQLARMERIEPPEAMAPVVRFSFPQPARSGQRVIRLTGIHQGYGEDPNRHWVYRGLDLEVERGQRIVLVGPNGAGKSTLLKILAGVIPHQQGEREPGHNARIGYYAQYRVEMLDEKRTVLAEAVNGVRGVSEEFVRTVLGAFLFRGDDVFKSVGVLSGGEKSRLALVKLLLDPPNLLLMDEPTTHLDIPSIDALITALQQFEGTVVFVSHDVYFIRAIAQQVLHVQAGSTKFYPGDYQYFLDKTSATSERAALVAGTRLTQQPQQNVEPTPQRQRIFKTKEEKRAEAEARNAKAKERREAAARVERLEAEVVALEKRQLELTTALESPETYADQGKAFRINRELAEIADKIERTTTEWEATSALLPASEPTE